MPTLIKDDAVTTSDWQLVSNKDCQLSDLPAGKVIVPLQLWKQHQQALSARGDVGVWLDSDEPAEELGDSASSLPLIAINFPVFSDGRGYSYARKLRCRFNFTGELRAIGDVLLDQLFYLKQVGFDSFELRDDQKAEQAIAKLQSFKFSYQATVDRPSPLFQSR